jgi:hypothetical protein
MMKLGGGVEIEGIWEKILSSITGSMGDEIEKITWTDPTQILLFDLYYSTD